MNGLLHLNFSHINCLLAGLIGGPAEQTQGVRGGRVRVQATHRGAGAHPPGCPGGHDLREQVHIT